MTTCGSLHRADGMPQGWEHVSLGEVVESLRNGIYKPAEFYGSGVPCLRMYNIESGSIVWKDIHLMRLSERETTHYWLLPGDILINRVNSRELVGKAAVIPEGLGIVVFESKNIRMRLLPGSLLPDFVSSFLLTRLARDQIEGQAKQTVGMATINQEHIKSWQIPMPPLAEQRRIVAKIAALFQQSRRGREALEAIPGLLARFRQSVLATAFRGELSERDADDEPASLLLERIRAERRERWEEELRAKGVDPSRRTYKEPAAPDTSSLPELPEGWVWSTAGDIAEVVTGTTPPKKDPANYGDYIPFVKPPQLMDGLVDSADESLSEVGAQLARIVPGGSVLVSCIGILGKTGITGRSVAFNQQINAMVIPDRIEPQYILYYFQSARARARLHERASATTVTIINKSKFMTTPMPLPPTREQRLIVARIGALFAQADILEAQVVAARRRLEQVDQAILARAFRGELVEQDPGDEPASVLLERVRREREGSSA